MATAKLAIFDPEIAISLQRPWRACSARVAAGAISSMRLSNAVLDRIAAAIFRQDVQQIILVQTIEPKRVVFVVLN